MMKILLLLAVASASGFVLSIPTSRRSLPTTRWNDASTDTLNRFRVAPKIQSNMQLRGGGIIDSMSAISMQFTGSPTNFFNGLLSLLGIIAFGWKAIELKSNKVESDNFNSEKPAGVKSLQLRFLVVFWLLRMADWLQGPYFYEVYSSKIINSLPVSLDLVSKLFLVGFASTGIFGPWIGRLVDTVGRKAGTLVYALMYTIGALSTRSSALSLLLLGRVAGGVGTSLLFSAPEAWLVGESQQNKFDGKWLGQTFGWAYAGDAIVAIIAGQLASMANAKEGPTGPFTLSVAFLAIGSLIALFQWKENVAPKREPTAASITTTGATTTTVAIDESKPSIKDAMELMLADKKIMLLGAVQALFEGAMYIFVLQWPPAMKAAIASTFGSIGQQVPFGTIFSCFMASCLLGSTMFGALQSKKVDTEVSTTAMLALATTAITAATIVGSSSLGVLTLALFLFEACVGMYFPSIGTLRSKYLPDSHRSVIMNLIGIPLNLIVVSVFLSIKRLGVTGALACSSVALAGATVSMSLLTSIAKDSKK